jgi:hypothetical protein
VPSIFVQHVFGATIFFGTDVQRENAIIMHLARHVTGWSTTDWGAMPSRRRIHSAAMLTATREYGDDDRASPRLQVQVVSSAEQCVGIKPTKTSVPRNQTTKTSNVSSSVLCFSIASRRTVRRTAFKINTFAVEGNVPMSVRRYPTEGSIACN